MIGKFDTFTLEGRRRRSDVASAIIGARLDLTMDGASTFELTLHDTHRVLLLSGIFDRLVVARLDDYPYELVKIRKTGDDITVTFEDRAVAKLRRTDKPRKVAPGKMSHLRFAKLLVGETPSVPFRGPPASVSPPRSKVELARGRPASDTQDAQREDTWTAIGRLAEERNWRRFIRGGEVWYMPESYLADRESVATLREHKNGVDHIDFDFDTDKRVSSATVNAHSDRWELLPGDVVRVPKLGPASGKWLIEQVSRSDLFSTALTVTLTRAQPTLPEPD